MLFGAFFEDRGLNIPAAVAKLICLELPNLDATKIIVSNHSSPLDRDSHHTCRSQLEKLHNVPTSVAGLEIVFWKLEFGELNTEV